MTNAVLQRINARVRPLNDIQATDALLRIAVELTPEEQQRYWLLDAPKAGRVFVFSHEQHPGKLVEYVQGSQEDSVSTLYEADQLFADLGDLRRAREELIDEIAASMLALPSTITVRDEGRGRDVGLHELGTAQLVDLLAQALGTTV